MLCPPPPSTGAYRWVAGHIFFSVGIRVPEFYVDRLSHFSSVTPKLHVHYLDVVPVRPVLSVDEHIVSPFPAFPEEAIS